MKNKQKATTKKRKTHIQGINTRKIVASFLILILLAYCVYKVIILVQNPADTFTVEQGKIYQEESATRLYY